MSSDSNTPHSPPPPSPEEAAIAPTLREQFAKLKDTFRRLGPAAPLAIAVMVFPPVGSAALIILLSTTRLATWMKEHPATSLPTYTFGFWVLGLCFLPTYIYSMVGGWAFGFRNGMIATTIAYAGASAAAFAISRWIARDRVLPLIEEHPKLARVRDALVGASFWRTLVIISLLRIAPVSPFAITNFVLGAGGVSWPAYLLGTAIGVIPRTALVVWFAAGLSEMPFNSGWGQWLMLGLGGTVAIVVVAIASWLAHGELDRQLRPAEPVSR